LKSKQTVFVFGSNLAGRHGKGSALTAKITHGAEYGIGEGRTGNSYALPTKDANLRVRTLDAILKSILTFIEYAKSNPDLLFLVVEIGCMNAGYTKEQIAPLFSGVPSNCLLPQGWSELYDPKYDLKVIDL
jgi:hypothetical protein